MSSSNAQSVAAPDALARGNVPSSHPLSGVRLIIVGEKQLAPELRQMLGDLPIACLGTDAALRGVKLRAADVILATESAQLRELQENLELGVEGGTSSPLVIALMDSGETELEAADLFELRCVPARGQAKVVAQRIYNSLKMGLMAKGILRRKSRGEPPPNAVPEASTELDVPVPSASLTPAQKPPVTSQRPDALESRVVESAPPSAGPQEKAVNISSQVGASTDAEAEVAASPVAVGKATKLGGASAKAGTTASPKSSPKSAASKGLKSPLLSKGKKSLAPKPSRKSTPSGGRSSVGAGAKPSPAAPVSLSPQGKKEDSSLGRTASLGQALRRPKAVSSPRSEAGTQTSARKGRETTKASAPRPKGGKEGLAGKPALGGRGQGSSGARSLHPRSAKSGRKPGEINIRPRRPSPQRAEPVGGPPAALASPVALSAKPQQVHKAEPPAAPLAAPLPVNHSLPMPPPAPAPVVPSEAQPLGAANNPVPVPPPPPASPPVVALPCVPLPPPTAVVGDVPPPPPPPTAASEGESRPLPSLIGSASDEPVLDGSRWLLLDDQVARAHAVATALNERGASVEVAGLVPSETRYQTLRNVDAAGVLVSESDLRKVAGVLRRFAQDERLRWTPLVPVRWAGIYDEASARIRGELLEPVLSPHCRPERDLADLGGGGRFQLEQAGPARLLRAVHRLSGCLSIEFGARSWDLQLHQGALVGCRADGQEVPQSRVESVFGGILSLERAGVRFEVSQGDFGGGQEALADLAQLLRRNSIDGPSTPQTLAATAQVRSMETHSARALPKGSLPAVSGPSSSDGPTMRFSQDEQARFLAQAANSSVSPLTGLELDTAAKSAPEVPGTRTSGLAVGPTSRPRSSASALGLDGWGDDSPVPVARGLLVSLDDQPTKRTRLKRVLREWARRLRPMLGPLSSLAARMRPAVVRLKPALQRRGPIAARVRQRWLSTSSKGRWAIVTAVAGLVLVVFSIPTLLRDAEEPVGASPKSPEASPEPESLAASAREGTTLAAEPESKAKAEPGPKVEAEPGSKAEAEPGSKAEAEPGSKAEAEPESKTEAEPESKPDAMPAGCGRWLAGHKPGPPRVDQAKSAWRMARKAIAKGNTQKAEEFLCLSAVMDTTGPGPLGLVRFQFSQGNFKAATAWAEWAAVTQEPSPKLQQVLADVRLHQGRRDEAEELLLKSLGVPASNRDVLMQVARRYANHGWKALRARDAGQAARLFRRSRLLDPDNAHAHAGLSDLALRDGAVEDAVGLARKSVELNARCFEGQLALGDALAENGQEENAKAAWLKAAQLRPRAKGPRKRLGL